MGFLDALLGTNTNDALNGATTAANGLIGQTGTDAANTLKGYGGIAQGALNQGANGALASLLQGYGQARHDLTGYAGQAQNAIQHGVGQAVGTVQGSNALFQPYATSGQHANTMLSNALGLNGAAGNAAATSAFHAAPGYQFQVNQASDEAARKAASLGMAASGNTLDAITRLSGNLANQAYGSWEDRLTGMSGQGLQAAGAISGNNQAAAGYQYGGAGTLASLLSGVGSGLAGQDTSLATAQANVQNSLGQNTANLQTGLGNSLVGNSWQTTNAINGNNLQDASQQDAVTNANNGIFGKLLGSGLNLGFKALTL